MDTDLKQPLILLPADRRTALRSLPLPTVLRQRTGKISVADLKAVIKDYGYDVIEYGESAGADRLIHELKLQEYTGGGAFTYASGSVALVFVDGRLTDAEKREVLAHELGPALGADGGAVNDAAVPLGEQAVHADISRHGAGERTLLPADHHRQT